MRQTLSKELRGKAEDNDLPKISTDRLRERQAQLNRDMGRNAERIATWTRNFKDAVNPARKLQLRQQILQFIRRKKMMENQLQVLEARLFNEDQLAFQSEELPPPVREETEVKELTSLTVVGSTETWDIPTLLKELNELIRFLTDATAEYDESTLQREMQELDAASARGMVDLTGLLSPYDD
jgi:hypothetical protein